MEKLVEKTKYLQIKTLLSDLAVFISAHFSSDWKVNFLLLLHFGPRWVFYWIGCKENSITASNATVWYFLVHFRSFGYFFWYSWYFLVWFSIGLIAMKTPSLHQLQRCFSKRHWITKRDLRYISSGTTTIIAFVKIIFFTTISIYIQILTGSSIYVNAGTIITFTKTTFIKTTFN